MYIISKTTSRETVGKLLERCENLKPLWYRLSRHRMLPSEDPIYHSNIIQWGTTHVVDGMNHVYNKPEAIKLASNKGECRRVLFDKGIPVPDPIHDTGMIRYMGDDRRVVIRPLFHQKGRDFMILEPGELYNLNEQIEYASEFYPKTREYRVHVAHGKVLLVQEKVRTIPGDDKPNWNHEAGYVFETVPWKEYRKEIVRLAVDTIETIGLDFGAVDIMSDPEDNSLPIAVVCEVNTAPKLDDYTADRYAEYLTWLEDTRETRHFDIPEDTKARHYVFKHRELSEHDYDFNFKGGSDEERVW